VLLSLLKRFARKLQTLPRASAWSKRPWSMASALPATSSPVPATRSVSGSVVISSRANRASANARGPHTASPKTPAQSEQAVLRARDALPFFGSRRLKPEIGFHCSTVAIGRIPRQHSRIRRRKKPRPPVHSLARQKMQWPPFGLL
jgi:hypothetical protein